MKNTINVEGRLKLKVYDKKKKKVVQDIDLKNMIVVNGFYDIVRMLGNRGGASITKFGVGTSNTPAQESDTILYNQQVKPIDSNIIEANQKAITYNFDIETSEFNEMTICEFGLFYVDNGNDVLFSRRVLDSPIIKTVNIAITGTWTISFDASEEE